MSRYYKCDYMDSGINFEKNAVFVCCKTAHEGGGMPILAQNYNDFDFNKIFELKKKWKEQIASGNPPARCKGCPSIIETDELVDDLAFNFVDVNSFVNCNSKCIYCNTWSIEGFKETSLLPKFEELFEKNLLKDSRHGYVQFAGGEPALMKDFEKIVDLCLSKGISRYIVNTSGIKYSEGINRLIKEAETNICVSLDSGTPETYKKVKRVPCFEKVVENLKKYAESQKNSRSTVKSKYIILQDINDNFEEINKWYDLSLSMGIKFVVLDVEREWFKHNNREISDRMKELIAHIQNRCKEDGIALDYYEQLKCLYGLH